MAIVPIPVKDATGATRQAASSSALGGGLLANAFYVLHDTAEVSSANRLPVTAVITTLPALPTGSNLIGSVEVDVDDETVSSTNPFPVRGRLSVSLGTFVRAASTPTYTGGQTLTPSAGSLVELPLAMARNGGTGYLSSFRLATNKKSITPQFRVHLHTRNTVTLSGDTEDYRSLYADDPYFIGSFDLPPMTTPADTTNSTISWVSLSNLRIPVWADEASRSIWCSFELISGFTADSGQSFRVTASFDVN